MLTNTSEDMHKIMFTDMTRYVRMQRIIRFQEFVNQFDPQAICKEFIMLSRSSFDLDTEGRTDLLDYDNMILLVDEVYGYRETIFHTGEYIERWWIKIPCKINPNHRGIDCRLIDHLLGIGCKDCALENRVDTLYPVE